ncbi:tripartite motif-containing protein 16-like [Menidia menidia]
MKRREQHSMGGHGELKKPQSSTERSGSSSCWRHKLPLDVYCCTDGQVTCALCVSDQHRGHTIGLVKEERRRKQEELWQTQIKLQQILKEQERKWKNMGKMNKRIKVEARKTEDHCESIIVEVINRLQTHYLSLKELIAAQAEAAKAQVSTSKQNLQLKLEEIKERVAQLDSLAQGKSSVQFLQEWPHVKRLCDEELLRPLAKGSEEPHLPFEVTKKAVEQLGRQLEEFCDDKFASISTDVTVEEQKKSDTEADDEDIQRGHETNLSHFPGLPGWSRIQSEREVEPKTREEFLQYACELSLDPNTAHQDLSISEGEKEVVLYPGTCKVPAIRHPERFIHRRQVLCREGLLAERCYYEVEVKGAMAEIALTYKGIDRKSCTKRSAFGGNANSWSLDCSRTYSVSHMADSVQLATLPSQHRIGVYLKFKEGTVSFYEVKHGMKFLYELEAKFTEPLYPGFWLGEKCSIRICDLKQQTL